MGILSAPPSFLITDSDGIVIGRASDGKGYLLTGGTEGQVPVVQGDGTIAYGAAGASSLSELDDWAENTLTVPGALTVRQPGGVAGTDEVQIYHDGSNAHVVPQSGALYFTSAGANGPQITASGEITNLGDSVSGVAFGTSIFNNATYNACAFGDNVRVAGATVAIGYNTNGHNNAVVIGRDAGGGYQKIVAIGAYATGAGTILASQSAIAIGTGGSTQTSARVHAAAGECVIGGGGGINQFWLGGFGAEYGLTDVAMAPGGRTGTDLDGYNFSIAGGKSTGSGVGGDVIIQHAPAGSSGSSLNSLVDVVKVDSQGLTVLQPGGVAGTDEVQIYHDGSNAYIDSQSGDLVFNNSTAKINSSGEFTNNYGFTENEAFGAGTSGAYRSVAFGYNVTSAQSSVAIGWLAEAEDLSVVIGASAKDYSSTGRNVIIGTGASVSGVNNVIIGSENKGHGGINETKIIGRADLLYGAGSGHFIGGTPYARTTDVYFGRGPQYTAVEDYTIHGTGGYGTDIDGSSIYLAGGKGTGTGTGGSVIVQAAPVGLTGTSLNPLVDVAEFDADTTAGNTRFLIYDVDNGQLERVSVGAADSGGTGYKLLRIAN